MKLLPAWARRNGHEEEVPEALCHAEAKRSELDARIAALQREKTLIERRNPPTT